jgi:hypothetical protein
MLNPTNEEKVDQSKPAQHVDNDPTKQDNPPLNKNNSHENQQSPVTNESQTL